MMLPRIHARIKMVFFNFFFFSVFFSADHNLTVWLLLDVFYAYWPMHAGSIHILLIVLTQPGDSRKSALSSDNETVRRDVNESVMESHYE